MRTTGSEGATGVSEARACWTSGQPEKRVPDASGTRSGAGFCELCGRPFTAGRPHQRFCDVSWLFRLSGGVVPVLVAGRGRPVDPVPPGARPIGRPPRCTPRRSWRRRSAC